MGRRGNIARMLAPVSMLAGVSGALFLGVTLGLLGCTGTRPSGEGPRYDYSLPPAPNAFGRDGYGSGPLPFWMGLTAPEQRALDGRDRAAAGDAEALLDLAIFASGHPRTESGYDSIRTRVRAFVDGVRPEVEAVKKRSKRGLILFKAMHAEFFPPGRNSEGDGKSKIPPGYEFEQSALAPIFTEKKYNCVSSALLYIILAKHFGLEVKGVTMQSHAFAQVTVEGGRVIEVETTLPGGYGLVHDEAFYRRQGGSFFRDRGLRPGTFADYQARAIRDPLAMVAYNMNNQHIAPARMSQEDRCRLQEARAYLAPGDRDAQWNRLALYHEEFRWLTARGDSATPARMFDRVRPALVGMAVRWRGDFEMANLLALNWFDYAVALKSVRRYSDALQSMDSSLALAHPEKGEGPAVRENNGILAQLVATEWAEQGEYAKAEKLLLGICDRVPPHASFRAALAWLYGRWASERWNRKDWPAAIACLEKQKGWVDRADAPKVLENLINAHLHWAAERETQGDWPGVRKALRRCVDSTGAEKCRSLLAQASERR